MNTAFGLALALLGAGLGAGLAAHAQEPPEAADLRALVEADWQAQEQRYGRAVEHPAALQAALKRADQLLADCCLRAPAADFQAEIDQLKTIKSRADLGEQLNPVERRALYRQARWTTRHLAFKNPLFSGKPLVFMKRHRFICQMLHEYLGYFYDYGNVEGGGIYVLENPGYALRTHDLIQSRLPRGNYTTLALSYDAEKIYFAFAERAAKKPEFYSSERRGFHLYSMAADGHELRCLTSGTEDDFDPCPLPDGTLAFMSTRRGGFGRCHNPWEPLPTYTLHRLMPDEHSIQVLSYHETNEWHPFVLPDGRIIYTRWDYVDRSAANFHGLWATYPDGSNPVSIFGNYTTRINACYQPRPIPGSQRLLLVAGAHHADVGGSLVLVDPRLARLDAHTGEDDLKRIERLTPEVCFPEAAGWPKSYFHSPWPLSENYFLVSFSLEPLPGMGSQVNTDSRTGLYYFDRFGNLELLYQDADISCMYPIPLIPRPKPPQITSPRDEQLGEEGEFVLLDAGRSLLPWPPGHLISELRVFQVLPKTTNHVANQPRIGYANAESARMFLGTVPVELDGSAYFRVPARKPLYFQAVDEKGRALQSMRSITYVQPGERRGCIGCHETPGTAPSNRRPLALQREPSRLTPGPAGTQPISFPLLVQPVLDHYCVACHPGQPPDKNPLALTGDAAAPFTRSYNNLKPYVRWHEWGEASISQIATRPGHMGTYESPLMRILDDPTHQLAVQFTAADRDRLYLWLDANAPFYGTYSADEEQAQLAGKCVPPPLVQ